MQLATFLSALLAAIAAAGDTQPALAPNGHAVLAPRHTPADRQRGGLHRRAPPDEFLKWIRETKERKAAQLESDAPAEQQRRREQREFEDRERKEYDVRLAKEPRVEGRVGFDRDDPQRARPLSRDDNVSLRPDGINPLSISGSREGVPSCFYDLSISPVVLGFRSSEGDRRVS